jgi:hypothetical protein
VDYEELTVKELREILKEAGLSTKGRKDELIERASGIAGAEEEKVEEVQETEVDIMPSETPAEAAYDPYADARAHYKGPGSVSGEWVFDDIPGSIAAHTLEEALEKYRNTPGIYKVPGSH